jgi:hypothetical protein
MPKSFVAFHRLLALLLGLFILSHLAVHVTALAGPQAHIDNLEMVRKIYKNPIVEPLLAMAIILQVAIGIRLVRRRLRIAKKGFWGWVQILSGLYLAFFLLLHTSAALFTNYVFELDTNFYWGAGTVNIEPIKYGFMPYYFLGISSVFAHLAAAMHFGWPNATRFVAPLILVAGMALAVLIVATFAGAFYDVTIPPRYFDYFQKYIPG